MLKLIYKVFLFILILSPNILAAKDLHYAGIFLLSHKDARKEFPYMYEAIFSNTENYAKLSDYINQIVKDSTNPFYSISSDMGSIKDNDSLVFGIAISNENAVNTRNVDIYFREISITYNVLVFDFPKDVGQRKLISSVQKKWIFNIRDDKDYTKSKAQISKEIVEAMFKEDDSLNLRSDMEALKKLNRGDDIKIEKVNLRSYLKKLISQIPNHDQILRVGINEIILDQNILDQKPKEIDEDLHKIKVAQSFEARLSEAAEITLIPFSIGAIKNRDFGLVSKLADHPNYEINLPEPDIVFNIRLKKIGNKVKSIANDRIQINKTYGAIVELELLEPETKTLISGPFTIRAEPLRLLLTKDMNQEYDEKNWLISSRLIEALFYDFAKNLRNPNEESIDIISNMMTTTDFKKIFTEISI